MTAYIVFVVPRMGLAMCEASAQPLFVQVVFGGTYDECMAYLAATSNSPV